MTGSASTGVRRGHITFDAEGNNVRGSQHYSRVVHFPEQGISGVTIGRGYDMGGRSPQQIYSDLIRAGIPQSQARALSAGAGLRGRQAAEFVRLNRAGIGEITEQQQAALFNQIYPDYERRAETVYNTRTANTPNRTEWVSLHPAIRDVVVDIIYNGFRGLSTMPAASENNVDNFINYIQNNEELNQAGQRERSRRRVEYLNSNRSGR